MVWLACHPGGSHHVSTPLGGWHPALCSGLAHPCLQDQLGRRPWPAHANDVASLTRRDAKHTPVDPVTFQKNIVDSVLMTEMWYATVIRLLYNNLYLLTQHHLTRKLVRYQRPEQRQPHGEGRPQPRHRTTEERLRADILGEDDGQNEDQRVEREVGGLMGGSRGRQDLGVTIMGALLWPTVSSMVGR